MGGMVGCFTGETVLPKERRETWAPIKCFCRRPIRLCPTCHAERAFGAFYTFENRSGHRLFLCDDQECKGFHPGFFRQGEAEHTRVVQEFNADKLCSSTVCRSAIIGQGPF